MVDSYGFHVGKYTIHGFYGTRWGPSPVRSEVASLTINRVITPVNGVFQGHGHWGPKNFTLHKKIGG